MSKKDKLINLICTAIISVVVVLLLATLSTFFKMIEKEKLTISTGSSSIVYNGSALTNSEWELVEGELKEGHSLSVEVTGEQDGVGMSDNTIKVSVLDQDGKDVTKKYKIKYELGTLNVKRIQLVITAGSVGKVYDGTPLTFNTFYITNHEQIAKGHVIRPKFKGEITERGIVDNVITEVEILDADGKDLSSAYSIITVSGKLYVADKKSGLPKIPNVDGLKVVGEYQK